MMKLFILIWPLVIVPLAFSQYSIQEVNSHYYRVFNSYLDYRLGFSSLKNRYQSQESRAFILKKIDLLRKSQSREDYSKWQERYARSTRRKFLGLRLLPKLICVKPWNVKNCIQELTDFVYELDPSCSIKPLPSLNGELDLNPCMGSEHKQVAEVFSDGFSLEDTNNYYQEVKNIAKKQPLVDIFQVYQQLFSNRAFYSQRHFISLMSYILSSPSIYNGYFVKYEEAILDMLIAKDQSSEDILNQMYQQKKQNTLFKKYLKKKLLKFGDIKTKKITITISWGYIGVVICLTILVPSMS
jgi:hypothetical protein